MLRHIQSHIPIRLYFQEISPIEWLQSVVLIEIVSGSDGYFLNQTQGTCCRAIIRSVERMKGRWGVFAMKILIALEHRNLNVESNFLNSRIFIMWHQMAPRIQVSHPHQLTVNHLILAFTVSVISPISPGCILSYICRVPASLFSSFGSISFTTYSAGSQHPYKQHRQLVPLRLPSNNLDFS